MALFFIVGNLNFLIKFKVLSFVKEIEQATRKRASIRHAERNMISDCAIFSKSLAIAPNSSVAACLFFPLVQFVDSEKKK